MKNMESENTFWNSQPQAAGRHSLLSLHTRKYVKKRMGLRLFANKRCVALRCVALRCVALRCVALHYVALCCVALHCVALRYVALRCVMLRYVAQCLVWQVVVIRFAGHPRIILYADGRGRIFSCGWSALRRRYVEGREKRNKLSVGKLS
jgi:hypothetical protein